MTTVSSRPDRAAASPRPSTATFRARPPTSSRRSTSCRRCARGWNASRSSSPGSATICAPADAPSRPASRSPPRRPRRWHGASLGWREARRASVSPGPDGRPAYGGTPVRRQRRQRRSPTLRARGLSVTLYPFVMMDVPAGNALPDPWTGAAAQPPYPWRGPHHRRSGPRAGRFAGWQRSRGGPGPGLLRLGLGLVAIRRMVLHYAALAESAGGVDAFVIGSELPGLTRVRSASGVYPAVAELVAVAAAVRAVLGAGTKVVYGADWTEYGAHVLAGGSEVRFPLDPLFARCRDRRRGARLVRAALRLARRRRPSRRGDGARRPRPRLSRRQHRRRRGLRLVLCQRRPTAPPSARTPITDGAYGKPWVFRQKDLVAWWSNAHRERVGGVELAGPTAWVPQSKPIWLLETGCPAVDKGIQPAERLSRPEIVRERACRASPTAGPTISIQARAIEAILVHWDATLAGHVAGRAIRSRPSMAGRWWTPSTDLSVDL